MLHLQRSHHVQSSKPDAGVIAELWRSSCRVLESEGDEFFFFFLGPPLLLGRYEQFFFLLKHFQAKDLVSAYVETKIGESVSGKVNIHWSMVLDRRNASLMHDCGIGVSIEGNNQRQREQGVEKSK